MCLEITTYHLLEPAVSSCSSLISPLRECEYAYLCGCRTRDLLIPASIAAKLGLALVRQRAVCIFLFQVHQFYGSYVEKSL